MFPRRYLDELLIDELQFYFLLEIFTHLIRIPFIMHTEIFKDYEALSKHAADIVAKQIQEKPDAVLGFATGSTPLGLYHHLIRLHRDEGLDFSKVTTFNLDEYIGLPPQHPQSYHFFMWQNLFQHVNVNPQSVYIPLGMSPSPEQFCAWYEQKIKAHGGIDLQILGIGVNGHLAFNEPGASLAGRTRVTILTQNTIEANARFFEKKEDVPQYAITMGIGTIMESQKLILLASGNNKADAMKAALEGPLTAMMPASAIQLHPDVHVHMDIEAASALEYNHHDGIAEPHK